MTASGTDPSDCDSSSDWGLLDRLELEGASAVPESPDNGSGRAFKTACTMVELSSFVSRYWTVLLSELHSYSNAVTLAISTKVGMLVVA